MLEPEHTNVVGGEATLTRVGAIDWDSKRFMVEDTSHRFVQALTTFAEEEDHVGSSSGSV